jgi:imidazole glycerol-phosphate synthase subunit HisF
MKRFRIIARLDIKGDNLIKGIHLEGLRVIGLPNEYAMSYYLQGIDEILYIDTVASLYGRNHLQEIIKSTAKSIFVPMTVGGGVRSLDDTFEILRLGADKVAINTAAVKRPQLIAEISQNFGSQCMVLSIEAKQLGSNKWEVYTDNGRESSGIDVIEWAVNGEKSGAGEILLTSVDKEGTRKGFDVNLIKAVTDSVNIPVIASGGMGKIEDITNAYEVGADAIAIADCIHYNRLKVADIRSFSKKNNIDVRDYEIS